MSIGKYHRPKLGPFPALVQDLITTNSYIKAENIAGTPKHPTCKKYKNEKPYTENLSVVWLSFFLSMYLNMPI